MKHLAALAVGLTLSMVVLGWSGYQAIREWRHTTMLPGERQADVVSDSPIVSCQILIVQADVALARILRDNFVSEGFEVQSVADGNAAVSKANSFAPDLVLLDVTLPGKAGFEVCAALRGRRRTPIVILSARSDRRD